MKQYWKVFPILDHKIFDTFDMKVLVFHLQSHRIKLGCGKEAEPFLVVLMDSMLSLRFFYFLDYFLFILSLLPIDLHPLRCNFYAYLHKLHRNVSIKIHKLDRDPILLSHVILDYQGKFLKHFHPKFWFSCRSIILHWFNHLQTILALQQVLSKKHP